MKRIALIFLSLATLLAISQPAVSKPATAVAAAHLPAGDYGCNLDVLVKAVTTAEGNVYEAHENLCTNVDGNGLARSVWRMNKCLRNGVSVSRCRIAGDSHLDQEGGATTYGPRYDCDTCGGPCISNSKRLYGFYRDVNDQLRVRAHVPAGSSSTYPDNKVSFCFADGTTGTYYIQWEHFSSYVNAY